MGDSSAFGFGKFIPGFEFLQNLGQAGAPAAGLPSWSHWVAPTVRLEDIEKRIEELKAVQFWLEQNSRALAATVQALEVQRMTLSTLKGMNVNVQEMGQAFAAAAAAGMPGAAAPWPMADAAAAAQTPPPSPPSPSAPADTDAQPAPQTSAAAMPGLEPAMQWWGALTQQFQHIAQQALQDPAQQQALWQATQAGSDLAKTAVQTTSDWVRQAVATAQADATPESSVKKTAPRKPRAAKATPQSAARTASAAAKPRTQRAAAKKTGHASRG